ncbi:unnamed protein product [Enterobius vermicularis]|uniref:Lipoprotein n=1 Tax=Enterobius vermicularis TaxID=51028 RepID=A0A0N4V6T8_ENTVE|nr:unnamed protein product [Enterobius vermicularis]
MAQKVNSNILSYSKASSDYSQVTKMSIGFYGIQLMILFAATVSCFSLDKILHYDSHPSPESSTSNSFKPNFCRIAIAMSSGENISTEIHHLGGELVDGFGFCGSYVAKGYFKQSAGSMRGQEVVVLYTYVENDYKERSVDNLRSVLQKVVKLKKFSLLTLEIDGKSEIFFPKF